MRLTPILLQEGRKEDLRKKYTEKFKEYPETLDFILGISDLADTNFKYGDFVLKNTHPNSSPEEVEDIIELVKEFDRFQQSLDVKDINRYDLDGLKLAIESHKETSKSQLKKVDTSGTKKIFEDKNILICSHNPILPKLFNKLTRKSDIEVDDDKLQPADSWVIHRLGKEIIQVDRLDAPKA